MGEENACSPEKRREGKKPSDGNGAPRCFQNDTKGGFIKIIFIALPTQMRCHPFSLQAQ